MQLQNSIDWLRSKKHLYAVLLLLFFFFVIVPLFFTMVSSKKPNLDKLPQDSSEADYSKVANIHDGLELLRTLEGGERYSSFGADLLVYAKESYKDYRDDKKGVVGFMLTSKISKADDVVSFVGEFGSSNNSIDVKITLLPNSRLHTSITDRKTKVNIDEKLPSNSPTNKYIATLPIDEQKYTISYLASENLIFITVFERDQALSKEAFEKVKNAIGETFQDSSVSISYPSPSAEEFDQQDQQLYDTIINQTVRDSS